MLTTKITVLASLLLCTYVAHASIPSLRGGASAELASNLGTEPTNEHRVLKKGKDGKKKKSSIHAIKAPAESDEAKVTHSAGGSSSELTTKEKKINGQESDALPSVDETKLSKEKSNEQKKVKGKKKSDAPSEAAVVVPTTKTKLLTNAPPVTSSEEAAANLADVKKMKGSKTTTKGVKGKQVKL